MSHFYGSMSGHRGEATRMGNEASGFTAHVRGWSMGIQVYLNYNEDKGRDEATVYLTGGSNGGDSRLIGRFAKGRKLREHASGPRKLRITMKPIKLGVPRKVEVFDVGINDC